MHSCNNIIEFENKFPDVTVILLEQNYRSTQTILDAANAVIENNYGRKSKELWTKGEEGSKIVCFHADDEGDEAKWVTQQLRKLYEIHNSDWKDMAVFYRTNAQSRVIEEYLVKSNIPYKVIGGTRFFDRKEIKDHGEGGNIIGNNPNGNVMIIDDVLSAGTAARQSIELIKNIGAVPKVFVVGLDRQEKGSSEESASSELQNDFGIIVKSIVNLDTLISFTKNDPSYVQHLDSLMAYREKWGT